MLASPLASRLPVLGVNPAVVLPYTLYEPMLQLGAGVTAFQLKPITLEEDAGAAKSAGAAGTALQFPVPVVVVLLPCADSADVPSPVSRYYLAVIGCCGCESRIGERWRRKAGRYQIAR